MRDGSPRIVFGVLGPVSGVHFSANFLEGPLSGLLAGLGDEWRVGVFLATVVGCVYAFLGGLAYGADVAARTQSNINQIRTAQSSVT